MVTIHTVCVHCHEQLEVDAPLAPEVIAAASIQVNGMLRLKFRFVFLCGVGTGLVSAVIVALTKAVLS